MVPLSLAPIGTELRLDEIHAGRGLKQRLETFWLLPGEVVIVVNDNGPLILSVKQTRLVIGRGVATKICVTPLKEAGEE